MDKTIRSNWIHQRANRVTFLFYLIFFSFVNRQGEREEEESDLNEEFFLIDLFVLFALKGILVLFLQVLQKLHNTFYAMTLQRAFITLISMIGWELDFSQRMFYFTQRHSHSLLVIDTIIKNPKHAH